MGWLAERGVLGTLHDHNYAQKRNCVYLWKPLLCKTINKPSFKHKKSINN